MMTDDRDENGDQLPADEGTAGEPEDARDLGPGEVRGLQGDSADPPSETGDREGAEGKDAEDLTSDSGRLHPHVMESLEEANLGEDGDEPPMRVDSMAQDFLAAATEAVDLPMEHTVPVPDEVDTDDIEERVGEVGSDAVIPTPPAGDSGPTPEGADVHGDDADLADELAAQAIDELEADELAAQAIDELEEDDRDSAGDVDPEEDPEEPTALSDDTVDLGPDDDQRSEPSESNPGDEPVAAELRTDEAGDDSGELAEGHDEDEPAAEDGGESAEAIPDEPPNNRKWYVVKVQSGRENTIRNAIIRKMKLENLEPFFGDILIPKEKVTVDKKVTVRKKKPGSDKVEVSQQTRRVVKEQTKYPGYLFVEVEFNDDVLYLFRETSGVGDFVGQDRVPTPMSMREVETMLMDAGKIQPIDPTESLPYKVGDKVRVTDGPFAQMIGDVKEILPPKERTDPIRVRLEVTIWDRPVPVELEHWQVELA